MAIIMIPPKNDANLSDKKEAITLPNTIAIATAIADDIQIIKKGITAILIFLIPYDKPTPNPSKLIAKANKKI